VAEGDLVGLVQAGPSPACSIAHRRRGRSLAKIVVHQRIPVRPDQGRLHSGHQPRWHRGHEHQIPRVMRGGVDCPPGTATVTGRARPASHADLSRPSTNRLPSMLASWRIRDRPVHGTMIATPTPKGASMFTQTSARRAALLIAPVLALVVLFSFGAGGPAGPSRRLTGARGRRLCSCTATSPTDRPGPA
jgi:hypothetical protein